MAAPNPEDELTRLGKLLARGLPPLLVITGPNDFFRAQAADRALAAVPAGAELRVIDAGEQQASNEGEEGDDEPDEAGGGAADAAALASCPELEDLRGGGLFARSAFVVVRRGAGWWQLHAATLAAQLPKFVKGCGLVLEASKLDKRKKAAQALVKSLADTGALFDFRDLYDMPYDRSRSPFEGELCKWVVARARELGVALQPAAAWVVVAHIGKQPAELLAELQRLRDRLGADPKRAPLAPADLGGRLNTRFESNAFELADAVLDGDKRAAFRSVRAMFDRGARGREGKIVDRAGLFPSTTSWLYQSLARTLEGRQLLDAGTSERDLPAAAGVRQFVDRFVANVKRNDAATLRRGLLALHSCQRASRLTGEEGDVLLERFLAMWFDGAPIPSAEDFEA